MNNVNKANRHCRRFHDSLENAIEDGERAVAELGVMFDATEVDGTAAIAKYQEAVDAVTSAKALASEACTMVCDALEGGGVPVPEDGGGK